MSIVSYEGGALLLPYISVSSRKCANFADEKTKLLKNKSSWQVQRKL